MSGVEQKRKHSSSQGPLQSHGPTSNKARHVSTDDTSSKNSSSQENDESDQSSINQKAQQDAAEILSGMLSKNEDEAEAVLEKLDMLLRVLLHHADPRPQTAPYLQTLLHSVTTHSLNAYKNVWCRTKAKAFFFARTLAKPWPDQQQSASCKHR